MNSSIVPWTNTLRPEELRKAVDRLGVKPATWDMQAYIRQDNWREAFLKRPGSVKDWDPKINAPMRLFPALSPDAGEPSLADYVPLLSP